MAPTDQDRALLALAADQHGVVADHQAFALGFTPSQWRHRLARGDWERVTGRVVRRPGSPATDHQAAVVAVRDAGRVAGLGYGSGLALWGVPGFFLEPWEVIVVRDGVRSPRPSVAELHRPRYYVAPFLTRLNGVDVARPALLILHVAPHCHPERLKRIFDWMCTRRLISPKSVRHELEPLLVRGRPGAAAVASLLDRLPAGYIAPASGLEGRVETIMAEAGLPPMRRQVDLGDGEQWCGRVDFVAKDLPLVLEVDSETYHSALSDEAADAEREARLEAAGFTVVRVTDVQVWHRRDVVVDTVRQGRLDAIAGRAA